MTPTYHNFESNGWFKRTLSNQLANVGSEFARAFRAKKNNNPTRFEPAFHRFLELINATLIDPRWTGHRKREIARLKENIVDHLYDKDSDISKIEALDRYFYYLALSQKP
jgi:hypothetical protein